MTDHDFSALCAEQSEQLEKKLTALHKSFVKDYQMAINVINNTNLNNNIADVRIEIADILNDQLNACTIFYKETFINIQRTLLRYL